MKKLFPSLFSASRSNKFCVNCKFFIPDSFSVPPNQLYAKCAILPKQIEDNGFLVTGKKTVFKQNYNFCSVARKFNNMCGPGGTYYQSQVK